MENSKQRFLKTGAQLGKKEEERELFLDALQKKEEVTPFSKYLFYFGALVIMEAMIYLTHLAYEFFKDSILFAFVLTLIGLSLIYLGVLFQRNQEKNRS